MSKTVLDEAQREKYLANIWKMPPKPLHSGEWLWWFWLFFIHDKDTESTGKCRQLMILWSVKPEKQIFCNSLDIRVPKSVEGESPVWKLNGAAACWYFDGQKMQDNFVLEKSAMTLDANKRTLQAPGGTPSIFCEKGDEYITTISTPAQSFEFHAKQTDFHPCIGPNHNLSKLPLGMEVEGTMIEKFDLRGTECTADGKKKEISGTAYFQKIRLRAPPPQWYWGIYHFADGSVATYMQVYAGRAALADNVWPHKKLRKPTLSAKEDIMVYHAPTNRVFVGKSLRVQPRPNVEKEECWIHNFSGGGEDFEVEGEAVSYAHACWTFKKKIGGVLPVSSTFQYNEYPSVLKKLVIKPKNGKPIVLENGWGNMENAWGFII